MPKNPSTRNLRRQVAVEAARVMSEQGIADYLSAKKKAADRLGLKEHAALPTNQEIEDALLENQRLFSGPELREELTLLRRSALATMQFLEASRPRLVGSVLSGAITLNCNVELHLFSDNLDAIAIGLIDAKIDYQTIERRVRIRNDEYRAIPTYCFDFEEVGIEALVFPLNGERQPPLCPINGKPMQRIGIQQLAQLIDNHRSDDLVERFFA